MYYKLINLHFIPSLSTEGIKVSMSRVHNERYNIICASLNLCPGDLMPKSHYGMMQQSKGKKAALNTRLQ